MDGVFDREFVEDLGWWLANDCSTADFILRLIDATLKTPRYGLGNPHFMKDHGMGFWGREINKEHLLVYVHFGSYIRFVQCRTLPGESSD